MRIILPLLQVIFLNVVLLYSSITWSQVSLLSENIINQTASGFTVLRDATEDDQWYYVPNKPRLVEIHSASGSVPEFTLLRYAIRDTNNSLLFKGGGIINFSVDLAASEDEVTQMKDEIANYLRSKGKNVTNNSIRLAALPFKSANAHVYTPDGKLLGEEPLGNGPSAIFATQKMVFSMPVTELGSDVYNALTTSNTGIPIAVKFKFTGLIPPATFTVDVNWKNVIDHYSRNDEFRARASYYGLFGGSAAYSSTYIREELEKAKAITIDINEGEGITYDVIDKNYLQPILKRINDELLVEFQPPQTIDPSKAPPPPSVGGWFASGSYSVGIKNEKRTKVGTERIDFSFSKHVERETVASNFIGIGNYSTEVQKDATTAVDNSNWLRSYLSLPPVPVGVDQIDMNVRLVLDSHVYDSQNLFFSQEEGGWKDTNDQKVDRISFILLKIRNDKGDEGVKAATYEIDYTFQANENTIMAKVSIPVVENGSISIAPKRFVDTVTINPIGLPWNINNTDRNQGKSLKKVKVHLKSTDGEEFSHTFRPARVDNEVKEPLPITWIVKRSIQTEPSKISGSVEFRIGNSTKTLEFNDLRSYANTLDIDLEEFIEKATDL